MKRVLSSAILGLTLTLSLHAQTAPDANTLTKLLQEFLAGASRNDATMHDRFWAEDVIYTGSGGRQRGKADIMRDVRSAPAPKPGDPTTNYTAEDIRIQQYGSHCDRRLSPGRDYSEGGREDRGHKPPEQRHLPQAQRQVASGELAGDEATSA